MTGSELIAAERVRQVTEEGYDSTHDAGHADELADAAASYAQASAWRGCRETQNPPPMWPWSIAAWKPTPRDRVRELVKAGALIAAAIDALAEEGETKHRPVCPDCGGMNPSCQYRRLAQEGHHD